MLDASLDFERVMVDFSLVYEYVVECHSLSRGSTLREVDAENIFSSWKNVREIRCDSEMINEQ